MVIDRRTFLSGALALVANPHPVRAAWPGESTTQPPRFVSACRRRDGSFALAFVTADGTLLREIPLSGRGHDVALSPDGNSGVAFARRPGQFAVSFDLAGARAPVIFESPPDRHFCGHGVFSQDGRLLYATENDFEAARGVLGVYDAGAGFRRIGELESHGLDPHEVLLLPDGVTLAVANGGIDTHPASGREKLNLTTMEPSLAFIDRRTGDLLALHHIDPALHKLSIRHLCCDARGQVWFGGQWEDAIEASPELVGRATCDNAIRLVTPREPLGALLKGYIGSVTATGDGGIITVSAPRAGRILHFSAEDGELVGQVLLKDACGIAAAAGKTVAISSGEGHLEISAPGEKPQLRALFVNLAFDNHMRRL